MQMQKVQPLREKTEVERFKNVLKRRNIRDWAMFTFGANTGLRASDILRLRVEDILDPESIPSRIRIADSIEITEKKTKKNRDIPLNKAAKDAIKEYVIKTSLLDSPEGAKSPLFPSRKGGGSRSITRSAAWRALHVAAKEAGIRCRIGTHTMRKTFGYALYTAGTDITRIQYLLNHSSPEVTLAYIGITKDETDGLIRNLSI